MVADNVQVQGILDLPVEYDEKTVLITAPGTYYTAWQTPNTPQDPTVRGEISFRG